MRYRGSYYLTHPWLIFGDIKNFCLKAFRRASHGFCHSDAWNMKDWFLRITPEMLDFLTENLNSTPYDMDISEWRLYLHEMSEHFRNADNDEYDGEFRHKELLMGMKMFTDRFWDLWD